MQRLFRTSFLRLSLVLLCLSGIHFGAPSCGAQTLDFNPGFVTSLAGDPTFTNAPSPPNFNGLAKNLSLIDAYGLVTDPDGNIYVADPSAQIVWVLASGRGKLLSVPAANGAPAAGHAYAVAGNGTDNFPQTLNGSATPPALSAGCVQPMDAAGDGCPATQVYLGMTHGGPLFIGTPGDIAVDTNGNVYIADDQGDKGNVPTPLGIRVVYASGNVAGLPSGVTPLPGHIYQISTDTAVHGLSVDSHGNVYYFNNGLQVIYGGAQGGTVPGIPANSAAGVYTIAGGPNATCAFDNTASSCANGGGPATQAIIPDSYVALDPSNNIYIPDTSGNVIRVIYAAGNLPGIPQPTAGYIYTVAGNTKNNVEIPGPATQSPLEGAYFTNSQGGPIQGPFTFDSSGALYFETFSNIDRIDSSGTLSIVVAGGGIVNPNAAGGNGFSSCAQETDELGDGCPANQVYFVTQTFSEIVPIFPQGLTGLAIDPASGSLYYSETISDYANGTSAWGGVHQVNAASGQINLTGSVGSVIPPQTLSLYNTGTQPVAITDLAITGDYSFTPTGGKTDCSSSTSLAAGASCQINVVFHPTAVGAENGAVSVTSNAANASGGVSTETLNGTGLPGLTGTVLTITPSAPSVANSGQQVVFTATVGPPNGAAAGSTPTGTVTFTDQNGKTYGPVNLSQASGSKSGVAVYSSTSLPAGSYTITAAYSGDANFNLSTSAPQPLTIAPAATPAPAVSLTASAASVTAGQPVTLTASLTAAGGGPTPTGTVTFQDSYQAGANVLGTANLSNGVATLVTSTLPVGTETIVAFYGGDAHNAANASTAISVLVSNAASLQIVPGVVNTIAGSFGKQGDTGDGGAASAAVLNIAGIAADPAGNLFLVDSTDSVVRRIDAVSGTITTVAGGGSGGDGGPATAAQLQSPSLVFADAFGNLYIGDSHVSTNVNGGPGPAGATTIRRVDAATGKIATIAGQSQTIGYTGDGGLATAAQIDAVTFFVDNSGNIYLGDSDDAVVRRIDAHTGIINTVAGNGTNCVQVPCGDGGPALSAQFGTSAFTAGDGITGVVSDGAGNLYISDATEAVIRKVDAATGTISKVAGVYGAGGLNSADFSAPSGDGGPATSAIIGETSLSGIDAAGNLYLANSGIVREINAQTQIISTVGGTQPAPSFNGPQLCVTAGQCGDGSIATSALLGGFVAVDGQSNIYIGDSKNSIARKISSSTSALDYGKVLLGSPALQPFTLTDNGSAPLTIGNLLISGDFLQQFGTGAAGAPADCLANSILAPGASCLAEIAFTPIQAGTDTGTLTIDSNAVNATQGANTVSLSGTGQGLGGNGPQTITFGPIANVPYGASVALSATASSGLPVSFLVNGPATLANTPQGPFLKTTGAGQVTITAYQVGDQTTYKAATPVVQSFTVTPIPLIITAQSVSITQGAAIPDLSKDYTVSGLLNGDAVSGAPTLSAGASSASPCGTYTITVGLGTLQVPSGYTPELVNGTLYVTGTQPQTISFTQSLGNLVYGGQSIQLTASASSGLPVSFTTTGPVTVSQSSLTIIGAGAATVAAVQYGSCTYQAAAPVTQNVTVAPAKLTVTANNQTIALGTPLPTLTYTIAGFVNNDPPTAVSGTPALSTTATSSSPSGTYPIGIAQGTLAAVNYSFALVPGTLTINPGVPQTVTFGAIPGVTYGAGPITLGATASSKLPIIYSVTPTNGTQAAQVIGNQLTILGAGTVTVTASQPGSGTYAPAAPVSQSFTIAPAVLTVTANDVTRSDDTQNPAFTADVAGFVNGDPAAVVSGTPSFTTPATPSSAPGNYPIVPAQGTLAALNYTFAFVNGNLIVTTGGPAQDYTVTANPQALSILAGQVGQTLLTVSPVNYYQNTVTFSCGTLPANVSCIFSPSSTISTDGVDPVGVTLTINTGPPAVSSVAPQRPTLWYASILPIGTLAGLLIALRRRRLELTGLQMFLVAGLSLISLIGVAACGSSSHSANTSGTASSGTFNLTVNASGASNGPSHSLPLSITVR